MPCYGYLFLTRDTRCVELTGLPADASMMVGAMRQDTFTVPSLGLVVTTTGLVNPSGRNNRHDLNRAVMMSVRNPAVRDPGPYIPLPEVFVTDPSIMNPEVTLGALGVGKYAYPGCTVFECLGRVPAPPGSNWPPGCMAIACVGADPRTPGIRK